MLVCSREVVFTMHCVMCAYVWGSRAMDVVDDSQSIDLKLNPINISLDQISRLLQISGLNPTNEGIQGIIEELKIAPPHNFMHVLQVCRFACLALVAR